MNTIKEEEFDYQAYMRENPPDSEKIQRGTHARRQRFETARMRSTIHIDEDILEQFRRIAPEKQEYEKLINNALREWLSAKVLKELVREELHQMIKEAFSSIKVVSQQSRSD